MQTVTGKLAMAGQGYVLSFVQFQLHERVGTLAGNVIATAATDINGAFSFSLKPGSYFLNYGVDMLPIQITESSGTTSIENVAETL